MKKLNAIVLAFAVVFALAAIGAAAASATEWLLNGAAIASPVSVDGEDIGSILFQDHGAFTEPDTLCTGTAEGTVGPGAADVVTAFTVTGCATDSGECKKPIVKPIHLPWRSELVLTGTEIRDNGRADGKGEPGYEFVCETFIGTLHDTCTSEAGSAGFVENNASGVVLAADPLTEPANCTLGGAQSGLFEGMALILALSGTLAIS